MACFAAAHARRASSRSAAAVGDPRPALLGPIGEQLERAGVGREPELRDAGSHRGARGPGGVATAGEGRRAAMTSATTMQAMATSAARTT